MKDPVFLIYNPKLETELHTDASREGYGAILKQKSIEAQQLHPVHYMSRKTTSAEKNYSSYELEVLALIMALKKLRIYLLGIKFKIIVINRDKVREKAKQQITKVQEENRQTYDLRRPLSIN